MSKFDWGSFYDENGKEYFAVSKQKFSEIEAVNIVKRETDWERIKFGDGFVRYRRALTDENELYSGWWLETEKNHNSCPCWVFEPIDE